MNTADITSAFNTFANDHRKVWHTIESCLEKKRIGDLQRTEGYRTEEYDGRVFTAELDSTGLWQAIDQHGKTLGWPGYESQRSALDSVEIHRLNRADS
jgi:hypothetical protein